MIKYLISTYLLLATGNLVLAQDIQGAWKSDKGVIIFAGKYFAYATFDESEFKYTNGGTWIGNKKTIVFHYEFSSRDSILVGLYEEFKIELANSNLEINNEKFFRIDSGKPGRLKGPWIFYNRKRDGVMRKPREANNPRKTMKILSGTRFQWIAYNISTKKFYGTGGGTYIAENGQYVENIDFFSRDQSRVGASLNFDFERKKTEWHHKGLSSKGDPIYEIWHLRE